MKPSLQYVGHFIGSEEITSVVELDTKTPQGNSILEFSLKNGKKQIVPSQAIPFVVTEKESSASDVQERRVIEIIRQCLNIVLEFDLNYGDIEKFSQRLHQNIMMQYDQAESYLWTGENSLFVPGGDPRYEVSLLGAYEVLASIPKNENSKQNNEKKD